MCFDDGSEEADVACFDPTRPAREPKPALAGQAGVMGLLVPAERTTTEHNGAQEHNVSNSPTPSQQEKL